MAHKYLNELGIKSTECCIFNSEDVEDDRIEQFKEERSKYGFDSRETWSLDFTLITWLYSHLKMFRDVGGEVVDLSFHEFQIPELIPIPESQLQYEEGCDYPKRYYYEVVSTYTLDSAIQKAYNYLEEVIRDYDYIDNSTAIKNIAKSRCALRIVAEILPALWW